MSVFRASRGKPRNHHGVAVAMATTVCLYVILVPILLILPFLLLLPLPLALFPRLILLPVVRLVASGFVFKLTG